jgi:mono/diheme cytochrome c family protein
MRWGTQMRRFLKWVGTFLLVLVVAAMGLYALAWRHSEQALARHFQVNDPPLAIAHDAANIARGQHLFTTRGCQDCHGLNGVGHLVFDAGPVIHLVAPNITPHGLGTRYSGDALAAAIRHGVRADGTGLIFMPAMDYTNLSDADTAALIAFVQSLPPSTNDPGRIEVRFLARVLYLFDKFPLLSSEHIDHTPRQRTAPAEAATASYGEYLSHGCTGCHGDDLAGQRIPGTPPAIPPSANLTPHANGLHDWKESDFLRVMHEGKKPDGSKIDKIMPWESIGHMSDTELQALWLYLRQLPAKPGIAASH